LADQADIWQWIIDVLDDHKSAMLMIVVCSEGSSPSKAGTKMAVTAQGESFGTIGGGALEYSLIKKAHSLMATESVGPILCRYQHNLSESLDPSGMSCGGKQTVLLYHCRNVDIELYRQLAEIHLNKTPGVISLTPKGLQLQVPKIIARLTQFKLESENDWLYQEVVGLYKQAYLIGGGHVSLGEAMRDLQALYMAVASTASVGEMPTVAQRLAPMVPALEVEIAHDPALFAQHIPRFGSTGRTRAFCCTGRNTA